MNRIILGAIALAAAAGSAQASITPTLTGGASTPNGVGSFDFTYSATLAADQGLRTGSYFTIYDFNGFVGFGAMPAGFTGSTQLVGLTPALVLPADDPSVLNVTFTYNGPDINYTLGQPGANTLLGLFTVRSTSSGVVSDNFTSLAVKNNGAARGTDVSTVGSVGVPSAVPEPATWAMMLLGFGTIGFSMRGRKSAAKVPNVRLS